MVRYASTNSTLLSMMLVQSFSEITLLARFPEVFPDTEVAYFNYLIIFFIKLSPIKFNDYWY